MLNPFSAVILADIKTICGLARACSIPTDSIIKRKARQGYIAPLHAQV